MTLIGHIADNNGNPLVGYIGGIKGITGRGIASIVENNDYTITIYLTDGSSYTTDPIAGFTDVAFDENYNLVVTKTDGTTITVETDLGSYEELLRGYKNDAEMAATNAGNSETAASGYASNALSSENNASTYANKASGSATAASGSADSASASASSASTQALKSEGFALGEQNGSAVTSSSPYYHNNSKYFSQLSSASATNSSTHATNASNSASTASTKATEASGSASTASTKASEASASALVAEGWAKGEQNGTPVLSGTYYEDNAKYYAEQAETFADSAEDSKDAVMGGIDSLLPTVSLPKADILSFTDGQAVIPAKSLVADIDPIQDLNGYNAPWVGGAGKNKLHVTATTKTSADVTMTVNSDGTVSLSGTANALFNVVLGTIELTAGTTYHLSGCPSGGSGSTYDLRVRDANYVVLAQEDGTGNPFTPTTSGTYYVAFVVRSGVNVSSKIVKPMICLGSATNPNTFEPYENICPISGHTEVGVSVVGVNQWDEEWQNGYLGNSGNFISDASSVCSKNYIPIKQSATYYAVCPSGKSLRICAYKADKTFISLQSIANQTFTLPSGTAYIKWSCYGYGATYANDISINYPSTDTEYHAYNGQSYTTQLGQTVYGGTLDVVSGLLTVDTVLYTLGNVSAVSTSSTGTGKYVQWDTGVTLKQDGQLVSDRLKGTTHAQRGNAWEAYQSNSTILYCFVPSDATVASVNSALSGGKVVLKLATPTTVQLTGQQVALLLGENHIFATSGKVAIVYNADVQRYIDNAVGTKEEDMVANNAISSGSLFSVNDRLYKATATIAVGETIVVGVNCTETSIIEQLNALITLL